MSNKLKRICETCKKDFYIFPSYLKTGPGKYCSRKCKHIGMTKFYICHYCGNSFRRKNRSSKNKDQKYCSSKCWGFSIRKGIDRLCPVCNKKFYVSQSEGRIKTCSRKCGDILRKKYSYYAKFRNKLCPAVKIKCVICKKEFLARDIKGHIPKTCSTKCRGQYSAVKVKCANCSKEIGFKKETVKKYPSKCKFCSISCFWDYYLKYPKEYNERKQYLLKEHSYLQNIKRKQYRYKTSIEAERMLKSEESVHHIDMDRSNNKLSNLFICSSRGEHLSAHHSLNDLISPLLIMGFLDFKDGVE